MDKKQPTPLSALSGPKFPVFNVESVCDCVANRSVGKDLSFKPICPKDITRAILER